MKSVDVKDLGKIAVVMGGSSGEREVSLMSGSGPTVFGIFDNRDKMAAAARSLRKSGLAKTVFATDIYNRDGGVTNDK